MSVVIPAHDAETTLAACVRSVLAGTRKADEIVVVDDASTDATRTVARELVKAHGVILVELDRNEGPATARNAGAARARADAYFFLDADTELEPDALERFCAQLAEADAVCGVYSPEPLNPGAVPRYKALLDHFHFTRAGVVEYDGFSGYCGGVRASAFTAIGGFDESLHAGDDYENEDFGYRLSQAHRTIVDPAIRARHHFPGFSGLTRTYFSRVSHWARLFARRRRFERAGDATATTGVSTACLPLALIACAVPGGFVVAVPFVAGWLFGYAPFFRWVARRDASFLPSCVALSAWFSLVISLGAAHGLVRAFTHA